MDGKSPMLNTNNEDVDMGLPLGPTNHDPDTKLKRSSGAGGNANSRMDMAFAASDPLTELVWSPQNGLGLKYTDSSSADKKPILLWNVGPSGTGVPKSPSIRSTGSGDEKVVDAEKLIVEPGILDAECQFADEATIVGLSRNHPSHEIGASRGQRDG